MLSLATYDVYFFPDAKVYVYSDHVRSVFNDGPFSEFFPPVEKSDFIEAARFAGYTDAMRFGIEHDVLHHFVAEQLSLRRSECISRSHVVWWDANGQPDEPETQTWRDFEKHVVMRLQRFINLGVLDDDHGVLIGQFGPDLSHIANDAVLLVRPWLVPMTRAA